MVSEVHELGAGFASSQLFRGIGVRDGASEEPGQKPEIRQYEDQPQPREDVNGISSEDADLESFLITSRKLSPSPILGNVVVA